MILVRKKIHICLLFCGVMLFAQTLCSQTPYEKKTAKLMTVWGENLKATDPVWPEYPRPQMVREKWLNLNGIWQFQPATSETQALPSNNWNREILVPFPVESALSGIMEQLEHVWYRRTFTIPVDWAGERVLLHFGAVDYACEVFINGTSAGKHEGGYDAFSFDITGFLTSGGTQTVALRVTDATDAKGYPRGKQTLYPGGIMYTSTTGIWQTVWLEAVPSKANVTRIRMVPDIDNSTLKFYAEGNGLRGLKPRFKIYDNGKEIADIDEAYRSDFYTLNIPKPLKLWSPDSPFLYDMKVFFRDDTGVVDSISTYFGMRKISKKWVDGYYRMMLNNKFLFQIGPLDQGFWPDGIYAAPCDEALRFDIQKTKELGFNMIRKHIKVEPQRWYYWADKLGMLIWQDMPSMNSYICCERPYPNREEAAFKRELEAMIKSHWNSPAIVSWVLFNEWQGSHAEGSLIPLIKQWDDSRLINVGSGGPDFEIGDIRDWHSYPAPTCPPKRGEQALVCGEYGGIGYYEKGHIWSEGNPYETVDTYAKLLEKYTQYADMLIFLKSNRGLNAAVYTEITDVEMELNGFLTYDRKVVKGNTENFYAVNRRVIDEDRYYTEFLPTSEETAQEWKYTFTQPITSWMNKSFDDSAWETGNGGFGSKDTPGAIIGTEWKTNNIWLRTKFTLPADALDDEKTLVLRIHHDENCRVYINGVQATYLTGYTSAYAFYDISSGAKTSLTLGGENTLAVHCQQTSGGQYIDVGVMTLKMGKPTGLDTVKKKEKYRIYPNPVGDELKIENGEWKIENVEIYDLFGRLLISKNFQFSMRNSQLSINTSSLTAGMYLLKLKMDNEQDTQVFIKK